MAAPGLLGGPPGSGLTQPRGWPPAEILLGLFWLGVSVAKLVPVDGGAADRGHRLLISGAVAGEAFVGLALLFLRRRWTHYAAMALPAVLIVYTLVDDEAFRPSRCGCFGPLAAPAAWRFTILGIALALAGLASARCGPMRRV